MIIHKLKYISLLNKAKQEIVNNTDMPISNITLDPKTDVGLGTADTEKGIIIGTKQFCNTETISIKDMISSFIVLFHEEGHILQFKEFQQSYNCQSDENMYRLIYCIISSYIPEYDALHYWHSPLETDAEANALIRTKRFLERHKDLLPENIDIDKEICNHINELPNWYGMKPVETVNQAIVSLRKKCELAKDIHISLPIDNKELMQKIDGFVKIFKRNPPTLVNIQEYDNFFHAWQNLDQFDEQTGREMLLRLIAEKYGYQHMYEFYPLSGILEPNKYKTMPIFQQATPKPRTIDPKLLHLLELEPNCTNDTQFDF